VMEYVDGTRIDRHCDERRLSIDDRLRLFEQVCAAVHVVHQNAVIHRDITAGNVLVASDGRAKLLDFGLAKLTSDGEVSITVSGRHWMTPVYSSPEQARGGAITTSTDIYSLGVLLYVLLTGCLPPAATRRTGADTDSGERPRTIRRPSVIVRDASPYGQQDNADPDDRAACRATTSEQLSRRLQGDLDNIVLKALEEEPGRRYTSADQFGADIARHLAGRPVLAQPVTWRYVAAKFVKRNRSAVVAAGVGVVVVFAAMGAVVYQSIVAGQAQARAERRFNDVRRLTTFLFEFDESIANVAGTTQARQLLVDRAREYFDSLASEAQSPDLTQELATAYERVGDIQGDPYSQSMGKVDDALASYQRSRDLRQRLYDSGTRDARLLRALAKSHLKLGDILWIKREFIRARTEYQVAKTLDQTALAADPSNTGVRGDLSVVFTGLGDTQAELSDLAGALESHRQSLVIREEMARTSADVSSQRSVAVGELKIADVQARMGDLTSATATHRRAASLLRRLVDADQTNALFGSNLIAAVERLCLVLAKDGKASEGVEEVRRILPLARDLANRDPTNAVAQRDVATSLSGLGEMLKEAGRPAEAMPYLREYLSRQEALAESEGNAQAQRDLWIAHLQLGQTAVAAGLVVEGEQHARESLATALRLWPDPSSDASQMDDLADAYVLAARVDRLRGRDADARHSFELAVSLREQLTKKFPDDHDYQTRLAEVLREADSPRTLQSRPPQRPRH